MNKFLSGLVVLGAMVGCGSYNETQELGSAVASMSAWQGSGWRDDDGWDHRSCDLNNADHVCYWPAPRADGQDKYRRLVHMTMTDSGLPAGVTASLSRNSSMSMLTNQLLNWNFVITTQGVDSNLRIIRDDSIYTGTPPNTNIPYSSIAHIGCSEYGIELDEQWPGSANTCKQVTLALDVGAFTAWVNQWAPNAAAKQQVLTSIFSHAAGVTVGLGASDAANTAMRKTLTKTSTPISLSSYDTCQANWVWLLDGSYIDPEFRLYTNKCVQ